MNQTHSPLKMLKSICNRFVCWMMLLALVTVIRAKDSLKTLKDRLENN